MIQALNDHVIVDIIPEEDIKTEAGIILPGTVVNHPQCYGKVISVGPKVDQDVGVGDIIVFAKHGGQTVMLNNKVQKVLKLPEIYGVVKK